MHLVPWCELDHVHGRLVGVRMSDETGEPDPDLLAELLPEERDHAAEMKPRRRASFVTGRVVAHRALGQIEAPPQPLLPSDRGAPDVGSDYSVSISHKHADVIALARRGPERVGVDVETRGPPRLRIVDRILTADERAELEGAPDKVLWLATVIRFSVKECVYKALDPWVRRYIDFKEAKVDLLGFSPDVMHAEGEFSEAKVELRLNQGEGPFHLEATWHAGAFILTTALSARSDRG